jgi:hypothetical protein
LFKEGATQQQEDDAEAILQVLHEAYPGHPWGVRVMDGGFFIQYLLVPFNKPFGMFCKYKSFGYSASQMKREIILKAGEWLERAGLARKGLEDGAEIVSVEGVPLKYQKPQPLPDCLAVTMHTDSDDSDGTRVGEVIS